MKNKIIALEHVMLFVVAALLNTSAFAQYGASARMTQQLGNESIRSPRFFLSKGDPNKFPLAHTDVRVNIAGIAADVVVKQIYVNTGLEAIEAIYVFPASTKAAVYGMTMRVADRMITAVIKEKAQARKQYDDAKNDGKTASLLEELSPNVFRMNVANILPGDSIVVTVKYTESLVPEDNVYEFSYPAVVGPRYVSGASNNELSAALNEQSASRIMPGTFDFLVNISTGIPLKSLLSPSHLFNISTHNAKNKKTAAFGAENSITTLVLSDKDTISGSRDVIVRYQLAGPKIESGLLLYEGKDENYFMLTIQPPSNIVIKNIMPREYIFIIDVSGSMRGFPLQTAQELMNNLLAQLRPVDRFNIMMFSGGQKMLYDQSKHVTPQVVNEAKNFLSNGFGGGGTELLPALRKAFLTPPVENISRTFAILTDGYVTVEREAFDLIRTQLNKANVYSFGIGPSVNRWLMEGIARAGKGTPFIVTKPEEAKQTAKQFVEYIQAPVLSHISVDYGKLEPYDLDAPSIPDATGKRPIVIFGKWRGKPVGNVVVSGDAADGAMTFSLNIAAAPNISEHSVLRYLWAKQYISNLDDEQHMSGAAYTGEPRNYRKEITDIGLKYNLLTQYTSFIAVDENIRAKKNVGDTARISVKGEGIMYEFDEELQFGEASADALNPDMSSQSKKGAAGKSSSAENKLRAVMVAANKPAAASGSGNGLGMHIRESQGPGTSVPLDKAASATVVVEPLPATSPSPQGQSQAVMVEGKENAESLLGSTSSGVARKESAVAANSVSRPMSEYDPTSPLVPTGTMRLLSVNIIAHTGFGGLYNHSMEALTADGKTTDFKHSGLPMGYGGGIGLTHAFDNTRWGYSSLSANILYDCSRYSTEAEGAVELRGGNMGIGRYASETSWNNLQLQFSYQHRIWHGWRLFGGAGANIAFHSNRVLRLFADDSTVIRNGSELRMLGNGDIFLQEEIPSLNRFSLSGIIGSNWQIPIGNTTFISPFIQAEFLLTPLANTERVVNLRFGTILKIAL